MKRYKGFLEKAVNTADLSTEPLPGVPLIELSGHRRVLIENHSGVIQYGTNEICIKVCYGNVHVSGRCLELVKMSKSQLVIVGSIECVRLCAGG